MYMSFECPIPTKFITNDPWFKKLLFDVEAKRVRKRVEDNTLGIDTVYRANVSYLLQTIKM